ncbi:hypothetical protein DER44DRAFT_896149 [Fusarium oxysporum]|nr:hypothetical protein DER44DRAFT_896149 [Fusarium oxysporum]
MLLNPMSRVVAAILLIGFVTAEICKLSLTPSYTDSMIYPYFSYLVDEKTMVECGGHIKQCGIMEEVKIIRSPISTSYVTQNVTTTTERVLPTQTIVIKSVKVVTVNNQTQGHCRSTTTIPDLKPAIITVNVTVEHVREIVPITNVTVIETSVVTATSIEQCFINNPETSYPPLVSSSQIPPPAAFSSQEPPVASASGDALLDGQGETEEIRHERIYQQVEEDISLENPEFIFQGD